MRWTRGFRHHCPLPNEVKVLQFPNLLSDADDTQKLLWKAPEEKRRRFNSERWKKRAKEKLGELTRKVKGLGMAVESTG
jgi:hypothetical protein